MDHKVQITFGRYLRASSFLSDFSKLKAFWGEFAGLALLESLEGLLRPR